MDGDNFTLFTSHRIHRPRDASGLTRYPGHRIIRILYKEEVVENIMHQKEIVSLGKISHKTEIVSL